MSSMTYEQIRAQRVAAAKEEGDHYRALAMDENRPIDENWWVYDSPEIARAVRQASVRAHAAFGEFFEFEDLENESWILVLRIADRARQCLDGENDHTMGTFQHELEMDMLDLLRPIYGRGAKTKPGLELGDPNPMPARMFHRDGDLRGIRQDDLSLEEEAPVSVRRVA